MKTNELSLSNWKQLSGSSQWGLIEILVIANYTKASNGFEKPPESTTSGWSAVCVSPGYLSLIPAHQNYGFEKFQTG